MQQLPLISGADPTHALPSGGAYDVTALHNFAALRGQLRVSFTPQCNALCWFCHNEGDVPPPETHRDRSHKPRERQFDSDAFLRTITSLMEAGLKRVYFTGGEPLVSRWARPVLTQLPPSTPDSTYTLITNGLLVRRNQEWLAQTPLDKIKVSLHYFSDESLMEIARVPQGIGAILDGIEAAREVVPHVELNTLLQRQNEHEIEAILDYALERRLPVQLIELVDTDYNESGSSAAVSAEGAIRYLRNLTSDEHTEIAGVGQGRRVFRVDGVEIDVIHRDLGRHHVGQCGTCPVRPKCVEGFWALRIDQERTDHGDEPLSAAQSDPRRRVRDASRLDLTNGYVKARH
ncbi:radical SAM protein [Streptomyces sp. NPDC057543]|uniref:radical SAM protein n=1 Tax=Streptomyces sp. NPDC057543 TaxID=3346163 RepID=UPI0036A1F778